MLISSLDLHLPWASFSAHGNGIFGHFSEYFLDFEATKPFGVDLL
jgi:hypothetical protein